MKLAGSVAIITGGASGLGAGVGRCLAAAGVKVAVFDLPGGAGKILADELGNGSTFCECDVTDADAVAQSVESVIDRYGKLNVCVSAAGVPDSARMLTKKHEPFPLEMYRRVLEVNLIGVFDVMRNAARAMSFNVPDNNGERGVIINVASVAAYDGVAGQVAYAASKGGVVSMTLPAARDLARWGIRVVTVCPGLFDTGMFAALPSELQERYKRLPVFPQRAGYPDEFGMFIESVVMNPMLNGESIRLDAGARPEHAPEVLDR